MYTEPSGLAVAGSQRMISPSSAAVSSSLLGGRAALRMAAVCPPIGLSSLPLGTSQTTVTALAGGVRQHPLVVGEHQASRGVADGHRRVGHVEPLAVGHTPALNRAVVAAGRDGLAVGAERQPPALPGPADERKLR